MRSKRQYSATKSFVYIAIFIITIVLWSLILTSCSDKYEVVQPQTLKYEVTGEDYYAVVYDKGAPGYAYMSPDHREFKGIFETPASIGDSVDVVIMRGGTPWEQKDASITITLGTDTVYSGDTKETGFVSVRGVLGKQLFVERKK